MIDINDETRPRVAAEYKLPVNEESSCASTPPDREHASSFSAHNPTLTRNLALVTWHGAGLQAIDLRNPARPEPGGPVRPRAAPARPHRGPDALQRPRQGRHVELPDHQGRARSTSIDVRNGLYILRYRGPHQRQVARAKFLDGNSNSGDAVKLGN